MNKIIPVVFIVVFLLGCGKSETEIAGVYLKTPSVNTIDSLFIYADSIQPSDVYNRKMYKYKQRFYNKKTGKLLFENLNTWWLDDGMIVFTSLYFDTDNNPDNFSYSKEAIKNAVIMFSTSMEGDNILIDKGCFYKRLR